MKICFLDQKKFENFCEKKENFPNDSFQLKMESEFLIRVKALRKIPCDSPEKNGQI